MHPFITNKLDFIVLANINSKRKKNPSPIKIVNKVLSSENDRPWEINPTQSLHDFDGKLPEILWNEINNTMLEFLVKYAHLNTNKRENYNLG